MERLPVETVIQPQPANSSGEDILVLTHDYFDKFVDDVVLTNVPQGKNVYLLEPSINFPTNVSCSVKFFYIIINYEPL